MSEQQATRRIGRSQSPRDEAHAATTQFWAGLGIVLLVSIVVALFIAPEANQGFADDAAVLAFLAATAVAIERTIELVWTVLSRRQGLGAWWPLNEVLDHVQRVEDETNHLVTRVLAKARRTLNEAKRAGTRTQDELARIQASIDALDRQQERLAGKLTTATRLAPGSARLRLVAEVADDARRHITRATATAGAAQGQVRHDLDVAMDAIDDAVAFIGAFEDNPARRIASLALGATLGVLVAGLLGLNVFVATLGGAGEVEGVAGVLAGTLGIILTGAILGFGAEPTHHVIKGLQRYKERNTAGETIVTGEGEERLITEADRGAGDARVADEPVAARPIELVTGSRIFPSVRMLTGAELGGDVDEEADEDDERETPSAAPVGYVQLPPTPEVTRVRRIRATR